MAANPIPGRLTRRALLSRAVGTAAIAAATCRSGAAVGDAAEHATSNAITATTIREAEKLHAVHFTDAERGMLATTLPGQVKSAEAVHAFSLPMNLQPACVFNPRLPGVVYPAQPDSVRLAETRFGPIPADDTDIAFASVAAQSHWIHTRQLTSRRLTSIYLERIRRLDAKLLSFITVTPEIAFRQADQADREFAAGRHRGALHGVPYGLKDVFDTAGVATTWGASIYRDRVPTSDSAVARKLREAGAVLLGKLATGELANGAAWFGGMCRNPWNTDEPAGGSSCGPSAATAAGLCAFAVGTDSLGSILNPADRCGITGLRATFGRVPVSGGMPLTPSLERIGPLTRRVEDAALVLAAINGPDPTSAASVDMGFAYDGLLDARRLTVGYDPGWFRRIGFGGEFAVEGDIDVRQAHLNALEALRQTGVKLVEVRLPDLPYGLLLNILFVEPASIFEQLTLSGRDNELLNREAYGWPNNWRQIRLYSSVDYYTLERFRRLVMQKMQEIYDKVDMLFAPTYGSFTLLMIMNFTGHPGISFRAGLDELATRALAPAPLDPSGARHTVTQNASLHGRLYEEGKIIGLARVLEQRLGVASRRPPGF